MDYRFRHPRAVSFSRGQTPLLVRLGVVNRSNTYSHPRSFPNSVWERTCLSNSVAPPFTLLRRHSTRSKIARWEASPVLYSLGDNLALAVPAVSGRQLHAQLSPLRISADERDFAALRAGQLARGA